MSSTSYSYNLNRASKKTPCREGKNCKRYPHCAFYHSPENTPDCQFGKKCKHFPKCAFYHSPENTPDCPFIYSSTGCTNQNCPYSHPEGFVHACIFGAGCKKRATCPFTHPDQCKLTPSREAPPPPLPPRDSHNVKRKTSEFEWDCSKSFVPSSEGTDDYSEDDFVVIEENGSKYLLDSKGNKVGVYDSDGHFVVFSSISIDTSEPDYEKKTDQINNIELEQYKWDKMTEEYVLDSEDEWESDPEAYN